MVLEWQAQAYAEGLALARAEGAEFLRRSVLRLLEAYYETPVPADLAALVQRQSDWNVLDRWFYQALEAKTLAEVRAAFALV